MNKKTVIAFFTLGFLVLPELYAVVRIPAQEQIMYVAKAFQSGYVNTVEPLPEDQKDCAEHLAELLEEGLDINDTNILSFNPAKVIVDEIQYVAVFHLSNDSLFRPKTAIIWCTRMS